MSVSKVGLQAYTNAITEFQQTQKNFDSMESSLANAMAAPNNTQKIGGSFADVFTESLQQVNNLQAEKSHAVKAFASGENQNVHELMITMQKASVGINMTTAVRNKVLEGYRELSKIQF